ncbi:hypothetical protein G7Y89_g4313 [Cudoniella acicularis]|uniref:Uncharacterized protein n=1 Tax=Cudoniella acicularis TaxID=354080 RepID=A0A8H4RPQ5_9HELO|nr:hypothetical protein G7Y89_g4313 [Cudoniella acicularis]
MGSIYQGAQIIIAASASADPEVSFLAPRQTPYAKPLGLQYERQDKCGGKFKSVDNDILADSVVVDVQIKLKGLNPFGKVTDGFLILEGLLVPATLSDWKFRSMRSGEDSKDD